MKTNEATTKLPTSIIQSFQKIKTGNEEFQSVLNSFLNHLHTEEQFKFFRQLGTILANRTLEKETNTLFVSTCMKILFSVDGKNYYKHIKFIFTQNFPLSQQPEALQKMVEFFFIQEIETLTEKIQKIQQNDENFENYLKIIENIVTLNEFSHFKNLISTKVFFIFQIFINLLENFSSFIQMDLKNQTSLLFYFNATNSILRLIQVFFSKFNELFMNQINTDSIKLKTQKIDPTVTIELNYEFKILVQILFFILENDEFSRDSKKYSSLILCSMLSIKDPKELTMFYFESFNLEIQKEKEEQIRLDLYSNVVLMLNSNLMNVQLSRMSTISLLTLINGILSIHDENTIALTFSFNETKKILIFDLLFPKLFEISSKLNDSTEIFFLFQTIHAGIQSFKKIIQKIPEVEHLIPSLMKKILDIIWNNWENPISNVFEL
jgi:hypothetical protein